MRPGVSGAGARRKGHQWERDVVRLFAAVFGSVVRRGLQYRDGVDAPDVVGVPGWWIECKKGQRPNPLRALRQAIAAAGQGNLRPVAICREDGREPTATLLLADFILLLRHLHEGGCAVRAGGPRDLGRDAAQVEQVETRSE